MSRESARPEVTSVGPKARDRDLDPAPWKPTRELIFAGRSQVLKSPRTTEAMPSAPPEISSWNGCSPSEKSAALS